MAKRNPKEKFEPKPAVDRLDNMTADDLAMERVWLVDRNSDTPPELQDKYLPQKLELLDLAIKRREALDQAAAAKTKVK